MMVYLWGRRNEHVRMSFLGLFPFTAPYLPWVLFSFSLLLGNSATTDIIGIIVGHMYYFLEGTEMEPSDPPPPSVSHLSSWVILFVDVYPTIARIRGWKTERPLATPRLLCVFALLLPSFLPTDYSCTNTGTIFSLYRSTFLFEARPVPVAEQVLNDLAGGNNIVLDDHDPRDDDHPHND
jgi:hypothetical protein